MTDDLLPPVLPELAHMDPQFKLGHAAARQECAKHFATLKADLTAAKQEAAAAHIAGLEGAAVGNRASHDTLVRQNIALHAELARLREVPGDWIEAGAQAIEDKIFVPPHILENDPDSDRVVHQYVCRLVSYVARVIAPAIRADERERSARVCEDRRKHHDSEAKNSTTDRWKHNYLTRMAEAAACAAAIREGRADG